MKFTAVLLLIMAFITGGCATSRSGTFPNLFPTTSKIPPALQRVLEQSQAHRVQILVTTVRDSKRGAPRVERFGYRVDAEYFYPASSIKLCAAVAALQVCEEIARDQKIPDLLTVPMEIAPLFPGDEVQRLDASNLEGGFITVGHEIRKLALVSDNPAFNRLWDVVGHERMNWSMHALGLKSVVINHRLSDSRSIPVPTDSAAVSWRLPDGGEVRVPARSSHLHLTNLQSGTAIGSGYVSGKTVVNQPLEFRQRNGISLVDLQDLLIQVARPDVDVGKPRLRLTETHRAHLLRGLREYPRESVNPRYAPDPYTDDYCKFLLPGVRRVYRSEVPGTRVEITGKIGRAYGFTVENSYLYNPLNRAGVFVTAVIYTNSDGVLNDDQYEYAEVADPFMSALGEWVARTCL